MVASLTSFFGRFHPVLVHLPIGILLLAFFFQLLSFTDRYKKLKAAVRPSLFLGMISAVATAASGYYLSLEGGYDDRLLTQHKWMGFATAGLAFILFLFSRKYSFIPKSDRKNAVMILFFPLVILLTWTGHLGGSLTHGEDFLFQPDQESKGEKRLKKVAITNIDEAEVFNDVIKPLLEEKCFTCHSSRKQKGQLRMDEIDLIKKGGKHGDIFVAGNPDSSELFKRITLSPELKEHMPPKKELQLTSAEIEVIRWWISVGAPFDKKAKDLPNRNELVAYLKSVSSASSQENWLPETEVAMADQSAVKELQALGVSVVTVAKTSNYLSVSFSGRKQIDMKDLQLLKKLTPQIVELNFSWTTVTDDDLRLISEFRELRVLHLAHTAITDTGLVELKSLQNLTYLNLVETKVGNGALASLSQMKRLKELYVFNTGITKDGLLTLKLPTKVDTGRYQLPTLATDTMVFRRK